MMYKMYSDVVYDVYVCERCIYTHACCRLIYHDEIIIFVKLCRVVKATHFIQTFTLLRLTKPRIREKTSSIFYDAHNTIIEWRIIQIMNWNNDKRLRTDNILIS